MTRFAFTVLFICTCFSVSAQDKVVIIRQNDSDGDGISNKKEKRNVENYNAFKFDPFRMAVGEIGFSWETRVAEKISLEFELGPTISNLGRNNFYSDETYSTTYQREPGMGILASAAVRYYPLENSWALNRLYVSPKFKYRRFNETINSSTLSDSKTGYQNDATFSFNLGYQQWLSNNFAFDYYIGVGIRSQHAVSYRPESVYDYNSQLYTETWIQQKEISARFIGVIGLKVTIGN